MSSPDACTCDQVCPGESCACIFVYDDEEGDAGQCDCDCRSTIIIHPSHLLLLSARVALNTDGVDLARLGAFLNERCEADVLVPEERERENVSLHMRDSTLADVIEAAGLTIRDSGPPHTESGY
jgi:hypothetical protein